MDKDSTVSLSVNPDLLAEAMGQGLNLEDLFERALLRSLSTPAATRIKSERAKAWQNENSQAIRAWNDELEKNGLWSDGLRQF